MRLADASLQPPAANPAPGEISRLPLSADGETAATIDLRRLWGLPAAPATAAQDGRQSLMLVSIKGTRYALLADACLAVLPKLPPAATRFPLPAPLKGARGAAYASAIPWQSSLLITLELDSLFAASSLEPLSAARQPLLSYENP
jgi:hypothetical protein